MRSDNRVTCSKCGNKVPIADAIHCGATKSNQCRKCSKPIIACRACGGIPKRKRSARVQTLEAKDLARYYWYECACGLREGFRQGFIKNSHARAYWNTQNALVHTLNRLCAVLEKKR